MSSFKTLVVLLLGLMALTIGLIYLGLQHDERLAHVELLSRAPTAPPLQEVHGNPREIAQGQTVYVPVYSHIYATGGRERLLEVTLSLRNTDLHQPIVIESIRYHDTNGQLLKEYLKTPVILGPLASTDFLVEQRDTTGGSGANFLVSWTAEEAVTAPIAEAIMVFKESQKAFAFARPGYPISDFDGASPLELEP